MQIEVISKVNVVIAQEDLEKMVITAIAKENPLVVVDEIKFIRGLKSEGMRVEVDAHLNTGQLVAEAKVEVTPDPEPVKSKEEPEEEPVEEVSEVGGAPEEEKQEEKAIVDKAPIEEADNDLANIFQRKS